MLRMASNVENRIVRGEEEIEVVWSLGTIHLLQDSSWALVFIHNSMKLVRLNAKGPGLETPALNWSLNFFVLLYAMYRSVDSF